MKVSIQMTVNIDVDAWATEYGSESTPQVRADVKQHVESMVQQQLDALGVLSQ